MTRKEPRSAAGAPLERGDGGLSHVPARRSARERDGGAGRDCTGNGVTPGERELGRSRADLRREHRAEILGRDARRRPRQRPPLATPTLTEFPGAASHRGRASAAIARAAAPSYPEPWLRELPELAARDLADRIAAADAEELRSRLHATRRRRYYLRGVLWRHSSLPRAQKCGWRRIAPNVELRAHPDGGAYYAGVMRCGLVWVCPVCAAKIAAERAEEIRAGLAQHLKGDGERKPGGALFGLFTFPHDRGEPLEPLRKAAVAGFREGILSGRAWLELRARYGIVGTIRALEVTHGENSWHPHLHVIFLTEGELTERETEDLRSELFDRWRGKMRQLGRRDPEGDFCGLRQIFSPDLAEYVEKMSGADALEAAAARAVIGAANELTRWDAKKGRRRGRMPFEILADYAASGSRRDLALWHEWERGMRRARQLTWSQGLKARFAIAERTDDEITEQEEGGELLHHVAGEVWDAEIVGRSRVLELLEAAERSRELAGELLELWSSSADPPETGEPPPPREITRAEVAKSLRELTARRLAHYSRLLELEERGYAVAEGGAAAAAGVLANREISQGGLTMRSICNKCHRTFEGVGELLESCPACRGAEPAPRAARAPALEAPAPAPDIRQLALFAADVGSVAHRRSAIAH